MARPRRRRKLVLSNARRGLFLLRNQTKRSPLNPANFDTPFIFQNQNGQPPTKCMTMQLVNLAKSSKSIFEFLLFVPVNNWILFSKRKGGPMPPLDIVKGGGGGGGGGSREAVKNPAHEYK